MKNTLFLSAKYKLGIVFLSCLLGCPCSMSQTRRALIIGLGVQKDVSWGKINGDKDIPFIKEMLLSANYDNKNIVTLVNEQATKSNIASAFVVLSKSCRLNDVVYIHFSGHGQRVTDLDGDEKDGWDESWIPYDAYREYGVKDRGEKHLIDDEIYIFLSEIKKKIGNGGKILVVVDACYSGGSSFGTENISLVNDIPFYGNEIITRGVSDKFTIPYIKIRKASKVPEQWITLSACKSYETNQELNNPHVGILSYALFTISRKGSVRMWKIEDYIRKNKGPYPQTPMISGEIDMYNISDILK